MTATTTTGIYRLDIINIILMLISCAIAYFIPWPLLLAAYAILGPAHYLTQISWMHNKRYFTQHDHDYLYLILLTSAFLLFSQHYYQLLIITLFTALALALCKTAVWRLLFIAAGILLTFIVTKSAWLIIVLLFLPTLIHVYIFTAGFILNGALKDHSVPGFISFLVLIGCAVSFFLVLPHSNSQNIYYYIQHNGQYFQDMVHDLNHSLGLTDNNQHTLQAVRFIAFAYTYHYFNWFSKTEIIKWHQISAKRATLIIVLYIASIALYGYDYRLGFAVLISLSFLHVILELPLDVLMIKNNIFLLLRNS